jgi:AraC-like DNA-binding protein
VDVLADVLASAGFRGSLLAQLRSRGSRWGCAVDVPDVAGFHLIADGTCWLKIGEAEPMRLVSGDVVLLPRGARHQLLGSPDAPADPYGELHPRRDISGTDIIELGTDGPIGRVVCGKFEYATRVGTHPFLAALPEIIHVPGMAADPTLQNIIHLLAAESTSVRPGSRAIATRLTEVLFVLTVRNWMARQEHGDARPSWLTALRDPRIGQSLALMHDRPGDNWTVEHLARSVAMSRPAFARQFKSAVGESPLAYLSKVRLARAARLLRDTDQPISTVANDVGYTSEFAFSRAFTREHGSPPGRYRRGTEKI